MITIITVNKNNAEGLKRTIESVVRQSYTAFEYIVIDGDSSDGSKQLISEYRDRLTVAVSEPDAGIYNAMNKAIKLAKGDYLLFLNSGDYLVNADILKAVAPRLTGSDVISGDIILEENGKTYERASKDQISLDFFFRMSLYHQSTFIAKKLFDQYGLYNETFKIGGDYEFFIRVFYKHNATYLHINELVAYFKADGISNNSKFFDLKKQESLMAWRLNVSERVYQALTEHQQFENSPTYWLYQKAHTSKFYKGFFTWINGVRNRLYRLFKK